VLEVVGEDLARSEVPAGYERRNRAAAPVVRRVPSALVGRRHDGSDVVRHRLARELAPVAFRPAARV